MRLLTFGHGTAGPSEITRLLREAGVERLVDVRRAPGSRRDPALARDEMSSWLPAAGIDYRWEERLGGWRKVAAGTPDTALRDRAFCGYAGHMRTAEFRAAIDALLSGAERERTAVMCAESVWWRCHRRMIADFLVLARDVPVDHLMHDGTLQRHRPSEEARVMPGERVLVYDAGQPPLSP
ncbi:DUF488 domain-containing protein [Haloechinothrix sp. YIM 98757]|uniref:DUF488 domain-containing protein n=1 Tax=Haloechinothrix aidingensis TaxID=2752311 RepID=A0A838AAU7_9PSEU|nr:DUF488 domain-containing protein [Haloechinothrix aidingensis]MBA0126345.1 DUF488 domain-containing protein [Haloechinothrix aidingensis]